jgi:hypothetical protein
VFLELRAGMASYEIIDPDSVYRGRTYSSYLSDWYNWLISTDADKHNSGSVVFLRANLIPNSSSPGNNMDRTNPSDSSSSYSGDPYFPKRYANNPNIMVGGDKLRIYSDQAIFIPIITAYAEASQPFDDLGTLQDYTGAAIDNGDNPPSTDQLLIDGNPLNLLYIVPKKNRTDEKLERFRIVTPVFPAIFPDVEYGRSLKDMLEMNISPGHYPTVVEGYVIMLKFNLEGRDQQTHFIHSMASAGHESRGYYFAELLYEIEVHKPYRTLRSGSPGIRPAQNQRIIEQVISEKVKNGELGTEDVKTIRSNFGKKFGRFKV